MRLTKTKLLKDVRAHIIALGYTDFSNHEKGLFCKKLSNGLYLSLVLEISSLFYYRFTASYYLSLTTRFGAAGFDIPIGSWERIGVFMTREERLQYTGEEFHGELVRDAWWNGFDPQEINNFLKVIEITEPRLVNDSDLISKVNKSKEVQRLTKLCQETKNVVKGNNIFCNLEYQPTKNIGNIPSIWFQAAEIVTKRNCVIVNDKLIVSLGSDAWRQYVLDGKCSK